MVSLNFESLPTGNQDWILWPVLFSNSGITAPQDLQGPRLENSMDSNPEPAMYQHLSVLALGSLNKYITSNMSLFFKKLQTNIELCH